MRCERRRSFSDIVVNALGGPNLINVFLVGCSQGLNLRYSMADVVVLHTQSRCGLNDP